MNRRWIEKLAQAFWEETRQPATFPRDLERAILRTKSVTIRRLKDLSSGLVQEWFQDRHYPLTLRTKERPLNGCVVAYRGAVFIFLEKSLPPADQDMVLAHEFGHYLGHYEFPRERIRRRLGQGMLKVYDGDRKATAEERIGSTLAGVPLYVHVHYMDRLAGGSYSEPVDHAERAANGFAFELMAPAGAVLVKAKQKRAGQQGLMELAAVLEKDFGLPPEWARPYARDLALLARSRRTFSEMLGL